MTTQLLKLAEESVQQDDVTEFALLKSAASILRRISLDFRKAQTTTLQTFH